MQESGEMYLESILVLSQEDAPVRSLDVARYLDVSKPSVSRARQDQTGRSVEKQRVVSIV
ncbi:MAG: hypothetical protein IKE53_06940 [Clostridiales bacterium]|nr:hypothetical protein [Clostridiales bacterium]